MNDSQSTSSVPPASQIAVPAQMVQSVDSPRKMPIAARQSLINLSLGMGIMLVALSGGAYLMMTNKEVLLGGKASIDKQSSFSFAAPTQVKPGEEFTVDVMLDSSADPEYIISGADAVIQYSFTPEQQQTVGGSGGSGVAPIQVQSFSKAEGLPMIGDVREVMDGSRLGLGAGGPNVGDGSGISLEEKQRVRPMMYSMFTLVKTEQGTIFDSYPTNAASSNTITPPPDPRPSAEPPQMSCGGFAGTQCPKGYMCSMDDAMRNVPDASGICVRIESDSRTIVAEPPITIPPDPRPPAEPPVSILPVRPIQGTTSISGIKNYTVDDQGYFKGFTGKGVFARLTFVANTSGKVELKFAYAGATATDDSNINGFLKNVPVNIQKSAERLLTEPTSLQVMITKPVVILPSPPSSPTPTPKPELLCNLDCKPGYECYQPPMPPCKEGECIQMMPAQYCRLLPNPSSPPTPAPVPTPTPTPTSTPRPLNQVSWRTGAVILDADDFEISITRNGVVKKYYARSGNITVRSDMNPQNPTLELSWTENDTPMRLFVYFTNLGSAWKVNEIRTDDGSLLGEWIYYKDFGIKSLFNEIFISPMFSITSSNRGSLQDGSVVTGTVLFKNLRLQNLLSVKPTPTPIPDKPVINVALSLEGRSNHTIRALVYKVVPGGESLLGQVQTDTNGSGSIQVNDATLVSDPDIKLFVEVPGFLRKYNQSLVRSTVNQVTDGFFKPGVLFATFGMLTAGDVHVGETGFGDHQVNSVDVADMYTQWSTATEPDGNPTRSGLSGDLNGDGVVNNRDYAIIMMNFGKRAGVVK